MIRETEVREILAKNIPELKIDEVRLRSLYKTIDSFAAFTKDLIKQGKLSLIRDCFITAEYLLNEGSDNVKYAIENIYVFSVTTFMNITGAASRQVKELLPAHLRNEYMRQISACGI